MVTIIFFNISQLPQVNPGYNTAPFRFTKYSNAYMLVYVRESDKEKVGCIVDEKDIAEHLRVYCRSFYPSIWDLLNSIFIWLTDG